MRRILLLIAALVATQAAHAQPIGVPGVSGAGLPVFGLPGISVPSGVVYLQAVLGNAACVIGTTCIQNQGDGNGWAALVTSATATGLPVPVNGTTGPGPVLTGYSIPGVQRPGYDQTSSTSPVTYSDTYQLTVRIRNIVNSAYSGNTTPNGLYGYYQGGTACAGTPCVSAMLVALNDYTFGNDVWPGALGHGTLVSIPPSGQWVLRDRKVVGNSFLDEVIAGSNTARNGQQIAKAIFTLTGYKNTGVATGHVLTQLVTTPVLTTSSGGDGITDQQAFEVYRANWSSLNSTFTAGTDQVLVETVCLYPWRGGAIGTPNSGAHCTSLTPLTGQGGGASNSFSTTGIVGSWRRTIDAPRFFVYDPTMAASPPVAYVCPSGNCGGTNAGNDTNGVISTTDLTAYNTPFLTLEGAIEFAQDSARGTPTEASLPGSRFPDGLIIYIQGLTATPAALADAYTFQCSSCAISGTTLTVTTISTGVPSRGQQVATGTGVTAGTEIIGDAASGAICAGAIPCTGAGGTGTYLVSQSSASTGNIFIRFIAQQQCADPIITTDPHNGTPQTLSIGTVNPPLTNGKVPIGAARCAGFLSTTGGYAEYETVLKGITVDRSSNNKTFTSPNTTTAPENFVFENVKLVAGASNTNPTVTSASASVYGMTVTTEDAANTGLFTDKTNGEFRILRGLLLENDGVHIGGIGGEVISNWAMIGSYLDTYYAVTPPSAGFSLQSSMTINAGRTESGSIIANSHFVVRANSGIGAALMGQVNGQVAGTGAGANVGDCQNDTGVVYLQNEWEIIYASAAAAARFDQGDLGQGSFCGEVQDYETMIGGGPFIGRHNMGYDEPEAKVTGNGTTLGATFTATQMTITTPLAGYTPNVLNGMLITAAGQPAGLFVASQASGTPGAAGVYNLGGGTGVAASFITATFDGAVTNTQGSRIGDIDSVVGFKSDIFDSIQGSMPMAAAQLHDQTWSWYYGVGWYGVLEQYTVPLFFEGVLQNPIPSGYFQGSYFGSYAGSGSQLPPQVAANDAVTFPYCNAVNNCPGNVNADQNVMNFTTDGGAYYNGGCTGGTAVETASTLVVTGSLTINKTAGSTIPTGTFISVGATNSPNSAVVTTGAPTAGTYPISGGSSVASNTLFCYGTNGAAGSNIKITGGSPAINAVGAGRGGLVFDFVGATRTSPDDAGAVHH